ncbi:hypothetical protein ABZ770_19645 [Streptomyces sp. NPDC006654]
MASPWQAWGEYDGERWWSVKCWDADHELQIAGLLRGVNDC